VITPVPRYLWARCCEDLTHKVNSKMESFAANMGNSLPELRVRLHNMIFMRNLKGVFVLSWIDAMGIVPDDGEDSLGLDGVIDLWGADPLHSSASAHALMPRGSRPKLPPC
jgi:hypothetical protein